MTVAATNTLNTLGESNDLALRWIPAHCGYKGNELADQIPKRSSKNDSATMVQFPIPRWVEFFRQNPPTIFKILWRDKFEKELTMMSKRDLRVATQILTGHSALNHHLSRVNRTVQPLCPLCEAKEETVFPCLGNESDVGEFESRIFRHLKHHSAGYSGQIQP